MHVDIHVGLVSCVLLASIDLTLYPNKTRIKIAAQGTPQVLTSAITLSNTLSQSHNSETVVSVSSTGRHDGMQQLHVQHTKFNINYDLFTHVQVRKWCIIGSQD